MGKKWTEVDIYTGLVKNEEAPTNVTGPNVAGTGDDDSVVVVRKKKKKTLVDARTKEYREHRKRLEQARERRIARLREKESNLVKKVKEQIGNFGHEEYIEEDNVAENHDEKGARVSDCRGPVGPVYWLNRVHHHVNDVSPLHYHIQR